MPTPAETLRLLGHAGQTVATCESITGGLICSVLTSVPGSSEVVKGGLITYATEVKTLLADVSPDIIAAHGVVSAQVAEAMAEGVRRVCRADWGVAVTGVAGPGPYEGISAGTVWLSVIGPSSKSTVQLHESGNRAQVRARTADAAVTALYHSLQDDEKNRKSESRTVN